MQRVRVRLSTDDYDTTARDAGEALKQQATLFIPAAFIMITTNKMLTHPAHKKQVVAQEEVRNNLCK